MVQAGRCLLAQRRGSNPDGRKEVPTVTEGAEVVAGAGGLREQVEEVLGRIRWALKEDGGDIEVVDIEGGVVKVRFLGACNG